MFQKITSFVASLNRLGTNIACAGLLVMTGLVTADVVMRRVLNAPIIFADEVAGYLLVLVTFMGIGYTLKEDGHIQVKILVGYISSKKRVYLRLVWCIAGIIYASLLLYFSSELTWESYILKSFSPTPSQLPLYPAQIFLPLGCLLFLMQLVVEFFDAALSLVPSRFRKDTEEE